MVLKLFTLGYKKGLSVEYRVIHNSDPIALFICASILNWIALYWTDTFAIRCRLKWPVCQRGRDAISNAFDIRRLQTFSINDSLFLMFINKLFHSKQFAGKINIQN